MALTEQQATENAQEMAKRLRRVADGFQREMDKFNAFVEQVETSVASLGTDEPVGMKPKGYSGPSFANRVLEMLDDVSHLHSGSTLAMYVREARQGMVEAAAGVALVD